MKRKEYKLNKKNKIEVTILDSENPSGFGKMVIGKDAYIALLESGARNIELRNGLLVYRKRLGIRINSVAIFLGLYVTAKNMDKAVWIYAYNNKKKEEQA